MVWLGLLERYDLRIARRNECVMKCQMGPQISIGSFEQPEQQKMGVEFETYNIKSMCRSVGLKLVRVS
jgi:hypothetical protein